MKVKDRKGERREFQPGTLQGGRDRGELGTLQGGRDRGELGTLQVAQDNFTSVLVILSPTSL